MRDMREVNNSIYQCTFFLFKRSRLMTQAFIIPTTIYSISVCCFGLFQIVIILLYIYTCITFYKLICVVCVMMRAHYLTTHSEEDTSSLSSTSSIRKESYYYKPRVSVVELYMENMHTNNKQGNSLRK